MSPRTAIAPTCSAVAEALYGPLPADLSGPTPCDGFDLAGLVEHAVGTTGAMARLGAGLPLEEENPWGGGSAEGDWGARLRENLDAISEGWSNEERWQGSVQAGANEMPATMVGEMALVEVAVHGWDLARALHRELAVPDDVATDILAAVEPTAELGRKMGAYGPVVEPPEGASPFERALAATGRNPRWAG
jgi:uncharacterized protein (TIGR03086 family)